MGDLVSSIGEEIEAKIRYASEVIAKTKDTLCHCRIYNGSAGDGMPVVPSGVDYIVFGAATDPEVYQAAKYLQSIGLKSNVVDISTVPDECRTFDIAFLPVVLEVKTGGLFINNPATSRKGFDAWRHR